MPSEKQKAKKKEGIDPCLFNIQRHFCMSVRPLHVSSWSRQRMFFERTDSSFGHPLCLCPSPRRPMSSMNIVRVEKESLRVVVCFRRRVESFVSINVKLGVGHKASNKKKKKNNLGALLFAQPMQLSAIRRAIRLISSAINDQRLPYDHHPNVHYTLTIKYMKE